MIKDRGNIKWTAMMLPEHVQCLKEALVDEHRIKPPQLDEQAIEEFEMIICDAMEFNKPLRFEVFQNGFTNTLNGTIHYINSMKSQILVQDTKGYMHHIPFKLLVNIQPE